jgi:hypothetical protein
VRQPLLDQRRAPVMQRRIHRPIALDVAQHLGRAADRVDRKLLAVVPDIGGPRCSDRRALAQHQAFVPMCDGHTSPPQLFLQLVGEAIGGEVRGAHAGNLNHRLSFAGKEFRRAIMASTSMCQRKTMGRGRVMHEYAHGELKSGPRGRTTTWRSPRRRSARRASR